MNNQNQTIFQQQLQELDELYYTAPLAFYEATLQLAVTQLEQILPSFTIALAEICFVGSERQAHGGMQHVLMPAEGSAQ